MIASQTASVMKQIPKFLRVISIAVGVAISGISSGYAEEAETPPLYEQFTLSNGMQVVVFPKPHVPAVSHMVWYQVGAIDEVTGKSGLAHYLEHMMFKETPTIPAGEFSKIIARQGGQDNAFTGNDYTAYFQNISTKFLPDVMRMEADRMINLIFDRETVLKERDVILEERAMRTESNPEAMLAEQMEAALYLNHPYGRPVIGWREEVERLEPEDAEAFYRQYYRPANATLIISGNVRAADVKPMAEHYYGVIPAGEKYIRQTIQEPKPIAARRIQMEDPAVKQPKWIRYYLAPNSMSEPEQAKLAMPLLVLSQILGDDHTGRLYKAMVTEKPLAASTDTGYDNIAAGPSKFVISITPQKNVSLTDIETAVEDVLAALNKSGVTEEELSRAKVRLKANAIYARESLMGMGYYAGQLLMAGMSLDYLDHWEKDVEAVTTESVIEALNAVLREERSVTGTLEMAHE